MADVLSPKLFDLTGKPADVPETQVHEALLSGKFGFQKGANVPVLSPEGKPGTVPAEQIHDAIKQGFTYEAPEAQTERIGAEENAGPLKAAEAFGAGFLRGPTFGLSDEALVHTGLASPKTLADLQKYRPGYSMAGEGSGILGSTFVDPLGAIGAVGDIGKAVAGGADAMGLNASGRVLEATGLGGNAAAAKILSNTSHIASTAAGSAVEGALYAGLGNTITEHALGDPDLNGEKIASNFGYGALLGGALGGVLKSAEVAVPEALGAARDGFLALKKTLIGTGEDDAGLIGHVLPEKLSEAMANRAVNLDLDEKMSLVKETTKDLSQVHNNIETSIKKLNSEIRPQETDALIDSADHQKVKYARQDVVNSLNEAVELMRKEPELYSGNVARRLEIQRDGIVNGMKHDIQPSEIFNSLREVKQSLQSMVFSKIPTAQEAASIDAVNTISKQVNKILHDPEVFGHAGASLAAHDEMLSQYYKFISPSARKPTEFQKAFMSKAGDGPNTKWTFDPQKVERVLKTGNTIVGAKKVNLLDAYYDTIKKLPDHLENAYANVPNERFESKKLSNILENSHATQREAQEKYLDAVQNSKKSLGLGDYMAAHVALSHPIVGAALEAYNIASRPLEHMNKLAEVERIIGKTTTAIAKGAKAIFDPAVKTLELSKNAITKNATEDRLLSHQKLETQLKDFANNPESFIDKVGSSTEKLHNVAPKTAQSLQQASIRATQFLQSKLPTTQSDNPFEAKYQPSNTELANFERYLKVVEKPMIALDQIRTGLIGPETIETLTNVYPKLYDQMKQAVLQEAGEMVAKKEPIPYQTKQSISMFLGQPMDKSLTFQSVMANQQAFVKAPQAQAQTKPSKTGMQKITLAERTGVNQPAIENT